MESIENKELSILDRITLGPMFFINFFYLMISLALISEIGHFSIYPRVYESYLDVIISRGPKAFCIFVFKAFMVLLNNKALLNSCITRDKSNDERLLMLFLAPLNYGMILLAILLYTA